MTQAPPPETLAKYLRRIANQLEDHGEQALDMAKLLAARGWPTGGSGNGGRSATTSSSTELAALDDGQWDGIDDRILRLRRQLWSTALDLEAAHIKVLAHTPVCDHPKGQRKCANCPPLSVGRGNCMACGHFCEGDGGNDRLRAGLCHNCNGRWGRYRNAYPNATRSDFITDTKREQAQAKPA